MSKRANYIRRIRQTPEAEVLHEETHTATVLCPYCHNPHQYVLRERGLQWRAPACGMFRTEEQRLAGLSFYIERTTPA